MKKMLISFLLLIAISLETYPSALNYKLPHSEKFGSFSFPNGYSIPIYIELSVVSKNIGSRWDIPILNYRAIQSDKSFFSVSTIEGQTIYAYRLYNTNFFESYSFNEHGNKIQYKGTYDEKQLIFLLESSTGYQMTFKHALLKSIKFKDTQPIFAGYNAQRQFSSWRINSKELMQVVYDEKVKKMKLSGEEYSFSYDKLGRLTSIIASGKKNVITIEYFPFDATLLPPFIIKMMFENEQKYRLKKDRFECAVITNSFSATKNTLVYDIETGFLIKENDVFYGLNSADNQFWKIGVDGKKTSIKYDPKTKIKTEIDNEGTKTETYFIGNGNALIRGNVRKITIKKKGLPPVDIYRAIYNNSQLQKEYLEDGSVLDYCYEGDFVTVKKGDNIVRKYQILKNGQRLLIQIFQGLLKISNNDGTISEKHFLHGKLKMETIYDASGRIKKTVYENGQSEIFLYDSSGKFLKSEFIK